MQLQIDREALELAFKTLLTCGCPATDKEEKALFDLLQATPEGHPIEYGQVLNIFPPKAETAFHRLADFTLWQASPDTDPVVITKDLALRHFASSFHWNHVVVHVLDNAYKNICSIPLWFLAHMLLPVKVLSVSDDKVSAAYQYDGGEIIIENLFCPASYQAEPGQFWAAHFAGLLCQLDNEELKLTSFMTESNRMLVQFRQEVQQIDYKNFERYGDYMSFCKQRYQKYYSDDFALTHNVL